MGVDPCKKFKEAKVESILARIEAKDLECPVCQKPFTSTSRMRQHVTLKHLGVTKHQCPVCKKYYVNAQSLKAHESSHDEKLNPHKCTICGKAFPSQFKLSDHLPKHGEPMYVCQYENCGRKYKWLRGKKDHERKCTYNEKAVEAPFKCEECGRDYWDKRSLDRHTNENHGDEPLQRLPCKHSEKTFKNKNSLDKHVKSVHQKKKPKELILILLLEHPPSSAANIQICAMTYLSCAANVDIHEANSAYLFRVSVPLFPAF